MTKKVRNSDRPMRTWLGGACRVPIACRRSDSTMTMRVKRGHHQQDRRQERERGEEQQRLDRHRIAGAARRPAPPAAAGIRVAASAVLTGDRVGGRGARCLGRGAFRDVRGPGEPRWCGVDCTGCFTFLARHSPGSGRRWRVRRLRRLRHLRQLRQLRMVRRLRHLQFSRRRRRTGSAFGSGRIGEFNCLRRGRVVAPDGRARGGEGRCRVRCRRWPWRRLCRVRGGVRRRGTACVRVGRVARAAVPPFRWGSRGPRS